MLPLRIYYIVKPLVPRRVQLMLRRLQIRRMLPSQTHEWPICQHAGKAPEGWSGWPEQKKFALVLTHDVDTGRGQDRCKRVIRIEEELGLRSSVFFVPERYSVSSDLRHYLTSHGFEVGVHGLYHDGKLYSSEEVFQRRAVQINKYLKEWNCSGFRSPSMHYNLSWLRSLDIEYDASTSDTDPFEPQPNGMGTIFPFWVPGSGETEGYVELPYTIPQDSTLFILLKEKGIRLWKKKLDWVAEHGGMALSVTHPDYMSFGGKSAFDTYPAEYYEEFLNYIKVKYEGQYWHALPRDMADFWVKNTQNIERQAPKAHLEDETECCQAYPIPLRSGI